MKLYGAKNSLCYYYFILLVATSEKQFFITSHPDTPPRLSRATYKAVYYSLFASESI